MLTYKAFSEGMILFISTFKGIDLSEDQLQMYYGMFKDNFEDADFTKAIVKIVSTTMEIYPGTNIIALILNVLKPDELSANDKAIIAWDLVQIAVRDHGAYASVKFEDDPLIHSVILSLSPDGTWVGYDTSLMVDNVVWDRKRFIETYITLSKQDRSHPDYLIGITEGYNSSKGHAVEAPHFISVGSLRHERLSALKQNKARVGDLGDSGSKESGEYCDPNVAMENIGKIKGLLKGIGV